MYDILDVSIPLKFRVAICQIVFERILDVPLRNDQFNLLFLLMDWGGILKLHDDVQTCGYEDVQVMWEMLRRYETSELPHPPKRKRPFWRIFVWSSNAPSLSRT
ncbi:hypothetical protein CKAN_02059200 [Cinnamomum micranthum f. kanehirae]|uniref:Uncharacterized protein n=1 Tax=Cinnamomum micranthum f. kanehirae TaxID=337451 RepID=A0A3S3QVZ1_9MAGN|nr:hypothetical protein CKAN_02059200 [Cinnamomum micranthum f. kanehirae]